MAHLMPLPLTISCSSKSRLVLPFWYQITRVVPDKGPLNGCSGSSSSMCLSCTILIYFLKVANFNLPTCIWHPIVDDVKIFGTRKLDAPAIIWQCLRDPTFSHSDTIPACDRQLYRQTHNDSIYRASIESPVKV